MIEISTLLKYNQTFCWTFIPSHNDLFKSDFSSRIHNNNDNTVIVSSLKLVQYTDVKALQFASRMDARTEKKYKQKKIKGITVGSKLSDLRILNNRAYIKTQFTLQSTKRRGKMIRIQKCTGWSNVDPIIYFYYLN